MTPPLKATAADRNAAVRLLEAGGQDWQAKEIRIGDGDHFPIVQAFARHRVEAQAGLVEALKARLEVVTPGNDRACEHCGGAGDIFGHSPDCSNDDCALALGIDDCNGQVTPCTCTAEFISAVRAAIAATEAGE